MRVAGEGVKPTQAPSGTSPQSVRVPLIKTAAGDVDYEVVLKYGGHMPSILSMREVSFPLVKTVNINVELSQVRLYLPDTHHWFDFGGCMTRVKDAGDLAAGFLAYRNKQIERLSQILTSGDAYSRARASNNLKQIGLGIQGFNDITDLSSSVTGNEEVQKQQRANTLAIQNAEQIIQQQEAEDKALGVNDNRSRFYELYQGQGNARSKNVVQELGGNFANPTTAPPAKPQEARSPSIATGSSTTSSSRSTMRRASQRKTRSPARTRPAST